MSTPPFFYRPVPREPVSLRVLGDAIDLAVVALAVALLVVMCANVAARVALNSNIAWNTEFGEFVLVWATFLGGAAAARRRAHMRIGELIDALPPRQRYGVELAIQAAVVAILGFLAWYGLMLTRETMAQEMTVLKWPVGLQYLAMPVGSALALVYVLYETALLARGEEPPVIADLQAAAD